MTDDPIKLSWQASGDDGALPPIDQVRAGAERFYRIVRRRNLIEYVACAFVVAVFGAYVVVLPYAFMRIGAAMVVAGTLLVAWQLHRRASARPPEQAGAVPVLVFQRAQLARQRDALASIFWWYILPLVPGMLLMIFGRAFSIGADGVTGAGWATFGLSVLVFGGVWWLNRMGARRLQKAIDEIDAIIA